VRQKGIAHLFLLAVVVIAAIGAIGYLAYQNAQLKKQAGVTTTQTTDQQISTGSIEPELEGITLKSPPIIFDYKTNKTRVITFNIEGGWEYAGYKFTNCPSYGGVCRYWVGIQNKKNKDYSIEFKIMDTSFNKCDFNNSISDDETYQVDVPKYNILNTSFGTLRTGMDASKNFYVVCQENVKSLADKTKDWVNFTDIGFIHILTPETIEESFIVDMWEIIENIKVD